MEKLRTEGPLGLNLLLLRSSQWTLVFGQKCVNMEQHSSAVTLHIVFTPLTVDNTAKILYLMSEAEFWWISFLCFGLFWIGNEHLQLHWLSGGARKGAQGLRQKLGGLIWMKKFMKLKPCVIL